MPASRSKYVLFCSSSHRRPCHMRLPASSNAQCRIAPRHFVPQGRRVHTHTSRRSLGAGLLLPIWRGAYAKIKEHTHRLYTLDTPMLCTQHSQHARYRLDPARGMRRPRRASVFVTCRLRVRCLSLPLQNLLLRPGNQGQRDQGRHVPACATAAAIRLHTYIPNPSPCVF